MTMVNFKKGIHLPNDNDKLLCPIKGCAIGLKVSPENAAIVVAYLAELLIKQD